MSDRLMSTKGSSKFRLPLEGSAIHALLEVDKEWQSRGKVRTFKAKDDDRYAVSHEHFRKFCMVPSLDENIEEGIASQASGKTSVKIW